MNLTIASINVNGFRTKLKHDLIRQFVTQHKFDILLLQETHVENVKLAKSIEQTLQSDNCIWNFGKSNSCGVAIFLFNKNIRIERYHLDFFGRVIRLDFSLEGFPNFRLINAYFPSDSSERLEFLNSFSQYFTGARNIILGGDFNFVFDTNLDKIGGNLHKGTDGSRSFKTIIDKINLIDCFRYLYPNKKTVTWVGKSPVLTYDVIGTRIDRFYASSLIKGMVIGFETLPCSCSDHSCIVLNLKSNKTNAITFGKSYWKFNNDLLDDDDFLTSFKYFWALVSRSSTVTLDWWDKMKEKIRLFCIDYSKGRNKRLYGDLKELRKQYNSLDLKCSSDVNTLNEIKEKVKRIETQLLSGSIIRSKAKILDCNENPSLYFFQKEVKLSKEKTVHSITHSNHTYSNSTEILNCFKLFYQDLYSEKPADPSLNHLFLSNLPQVKESDNLRLKQKIQKYEILHALKSMEPNKSPGSDGLSSSFYVKFFDIFGDVLTEIINLAFDQNSLSVSQKLSYITLICKDKSQSEDMKFYRPISLLNIDYKIISKIMSQRLGNVLPKIINIDQTCAVKGRSIFDNLHLIRNVIDYVEQKNLAASFICLDQEKAFDRVSWSYMYSTLIAFGFHENFIRWVKLLYTDISSSVIVNNFVSSSFSIQRGVRQGCSLSPLLYILCFEPFAQKIRGLDEIKGLKLPGSISELKLSMYADDSTGIFTSDSSMQHFFYWIDLFGRVSGSKINFRKSKGMFLGKWKTRSDHPFGISWIKYHKILGYTFGFDFSDDDVWSKLFLKFDQTLNLWKNRKLSFKGKSTVLNSLCLSKLLYYSTANHVPPHYTILFQRSMFRFVWNSKFEPISRKTLFLDFQDGGLKVPNLKLKLQSLYLSHLQKLICNSDAKWTYFAKYWIGLQLRKLNASFASNTFPHSEYIPPFYRECLSVLKMFLNIHPFYKFGNSKTKTFYNLLLANVTEKPKIQTICPTVHFKSVWKNIYLSCIDPTVRDTMYRLSHDVIFVNYYLYSKGISKDKSCPLCSKTETINHLFLECFMFSPLNKVVLYLLRRISKSFTFSERIFRFFELPNLNKYDKQLALLLLSESRHVIWNCRNLMKHENKYINSTAVINRFLSKLKLRILADKKRLPFQEFDSIWLKHNFCNFDENDNKITFLPVIYVNFYVEKKIIK